MPLLPPAGGGAKTKGFGTTTLVDAAAAAVELVETDTDDDGVQVEKNAAPAALGASGVVGVDG